MRDVSIGYVVLGLFLLCQTMLWFQYRYVQTPWLNIPDPPSKNGALWSGLGDAQLAYRSHALSLQNAGDTGGRTGALKAYDYDTLADWFFLLHELDAKSDIIPFLAAYYYGAIQDEAAYKLRPIVDYLAMAGHSSYREKWRWMAQAAFLARFRMGDLDMALEIANDMQAIKNVDLPLWARQMPTLIVEQRGEKDTALAMALETLRTRGESLHPNEVLYMVDYICVQLLEPHERAAYPICQSLPQ